MGPHCEFLRSQILAIDTLVKPKDQSAASIFTIFVACILFAVLLVVLNARRRRQRSKEKTAIITEAHREADRKPMMEVVDFELEDVELL